MYVDTRLREPFRKAGNQHYLLILVNFFVPGSRIHADPWSFLADPVLHVQIVLCTNGPFVFPGHIWRRGEASVPGL